MYFKHHGMFKHDGYHDIRNNKPWQQKIIRREKKTFEEWNEIIAPAYNVWSKLAMSRTAPEHVGVPETYGPYMYFTKHMQGPKGHDYESYCRVLT